MTAHVATEDTSLSEAAASSVGVIDYMKRRIHYLETQASQRQQSLDTEANLHPEGGGIASDQNARESIGDGPSAANRAARSDDRFMDQAFDEIGSLSLASMGDQSVHDPMISGEVSYTNFVLAAMGVRSENPAKASHPQTDRVHHSSSRWVNTVHDSAFSLSCGNTMHCVERFVEYLNLLHPCISRESCINAYKTIKTAEQEGTYDQVARSSPELIVFAYVSVGLGMLLTDPSFAIDVVLPQIVEKIRSVVPQLIGHASNLAVIESLMMIALLALHTPVAGSTWYLVGLAMTRAVSLGMHRQSLRPVTSELVSGREKLFWTLYKLDRTLSFAMDRPFCIDDAHIVINLPEMPHPSLLIDCETRTKALQLWSLYHSQMLSDWRNDPDADPEFYLSTFDYWRNTYQGISEKALVDHDRESTHVDPASQLRLAKFESQLCLRAITQLVVIIVTRNPNEAVWHRLRNLVLTEVPRFVGYQQDAIEKFGTAANFLHGYDVFIGGVIYIDALYHPSLKQYRRSKRTYNGGDQESPIQLCSVRAADAKVISSCSEILNHIAQRFAPMRAMKDVLWAFLAAVNAKLIDAAFRNNFTNQEPPTQETMSNACRDLLTSIKTCEVEIPSHIVRIITICLDLDIDNP